jgi:hypothetical protein
MFQNRSQGHVLFSFFLSQVIAREMHCPGKMLDPWIIALSVGLR